MLLRCYRRVETDAEIQSRTPLYISYGWKNGKATIQFVKFFKSHCRLDIK